MPAVCCIQRAKFFVFMKSASSLNQLFEAQKVNQFAIAQQSVKTRIEWLKKLKRALENTYRQPLIDAVYKDFGKPAIEVELTEVFPIVKDINLAISNLHSWAADTPVSTPTVLFGSRSKIMYQPKGVCLIISPWNFPMQLTLGPLVSAISAGNTVILKPSEFTPHTSKVMQKMLADIFPANYISVVLGGVEESTALLKLPFNHIFFTGSPAVGKIVMEAAAKNLTSVTLELGGKSPTIIDETADLKLAAKRVAWAKYVNAGQICIAPDYVFVAEKVAQKFIDELQKVLNQFFENNGDAESGYTQIISKRHFDRLANALQQATEMGAKCAAGGEVLPNEQRIKPTVLTNVPEESALMQEEIFGPILPVKTYTKIQEVFDYLHEKEKPLALYIFSCSKKNSANILANTRAGGTCVNHTIMHFTNPNLPFGGDNNSGIGKSHGLHGFLAFSNQRGVYKQVLPSSTHLFMPPYTGLKRKLFSYVIKWF